MTVGQRIKLRRKELEMTVDELAKTLNKNRATVYRYENGDIENLPVTILEPIAEALFTTPTYLLGYEEEVQTEHLSKYEKGEKILEYYNQLNDFGKKEAEKRVEELTYINKYTNVSLIELNAAHEIPGATEEDKKHDDAIMDDEDF